MLNGRSSARRCAHFLQLPPARPISPSTPTPTHFHPTHFPPPDSHSLPLIPHNPRKIHAMKIGDKQLLNYIQSVSAKRPTRFCKFSATLWRSPSCRLRPNPNPSPPSRRPLRRPGSRLCWKAIRRTFKMEKFCGYWPPTSPATTFPADARVVPFNPGQCLQIAAEAVRVPADDKERKQLARENKERLLFIQSIAQDQGHSAGRHCRHIRPTRWRNLCAARRRDFFFPPDGRNRPGMRGSFAFT